MRHFGIALLAMAGTIASLASCQGVENGAGGRETDGDAGPDTDTDADTGADTDTDADTDTSGFGDLQGMVYAPSGGFPISGALVYVTDGDAEEIPDHAYCYACDDMTGKKWTLSAADGTWSIPGVPAGVHNLVTRKGFFRRQRQIDVAADAVTDVPAEATTLPSEASADGLDRIPNYAVLQSGPDYPEDLLAKMGLGALSSSGSLDTSQPFQFDMYDTGGNPAASGPTAHIFSTADYLGQYHMVFFPCINSGMAASGYAEMLRDYVAAGGKIYGSCWASQWAEQPFPDVIEFNGEDSVYNAGNVGSYETHGVVNDVEMRGWLEVVVNGPASEPLASGEGPDYYPFSGAWILIDSLSSTAYDGHGADTDGDGVFEGPVRPEVWVTDIERYAAHPLTLTFDYDCGKMFYSAYQVVESSTSTLIRPQEWVLVYLFLEVGVCEGTYEPPE